MLTDATANRPLQWNSSWLRDAHAHMGGPWDISDMDSEPGKSKWWAKKNLEEMPHMCMGFLGGLDSKEDACSVGGECNSATLPESAHVSIYIYWTLSSCYMHSVFLHMCSVSLILYSQRFLPLFVLAMIIPLRCLQETKTDYLPCFCCYFHFWRANRKRVINSLTGAQIFLIQEMQRGGWLIVNLSILGPIHLLPQCRI